jgi:hypothetical protein
MVDVAFDVAPDGAVEQGPESRQADTYSCGHVVVGDRLSASDPETLDVERRTSPETVDPSPAEATSQDAGRGRTPPGDR